MVDGSTLALDSNAISGASNTLIPSTDLAPSSGINTSAMDGAIQTPALSPPVIQQYIAGALSPAGTLGINDTRDIPLPDLTDKVYKQVDTNTLPVKTAEDLTMGMELNAKNPTADFIAPAEIPLWVYILGGIAALTLIIVAVK